MSCVKPIGRFCILEKLIERNLDRFELLSCKNDFRNSSSKSI